MPFYRMPMDSAPTRYRSPVQSGNAVQVATDGTSYVASQLPNVPSNKRQTVFDTATSAASGQSYNAYDVIDLIATLSNWWQPTDTEATGVSTGSTVQTITAYVGSASLDQSSSGNRATFDSNGLTFDGSSNYYSASSVTLFGVTAFTLFTTVLASGSIQNFQSVFRFQDTSTTFTVFPWYDSGASAVRLIINPDRNISGPLISSSNLNLGAFNILTCGWEKNTTASFFAASNGVVRTSLDAADVNLQSDTLTVGRYSPGPSEYFNGTIKTIAIAKRSYTSTQRLAIERFFNFYNGLSIF